MTWSSFHRRGEVLRDVVAAAESRRDGVLPWDVDGVTAVFADERDLLGALQLTWHTRLSGRIDRLQSHGTGSLEQAVVDAWHEVHDELGGVRRVLDAARDSDLEPVREAMGRATAKERLMLAVAAGLGNPQGRASLRVGERIEQRARDTYPAHLGRLADQAPTTLGPTVLDRVLGRLKAALAA